MEVGELIQSKLGAARSRSAYIALIAIGAIVSGLGGLVKLPSPVGSVALDSAPGFFIAAYAAPIAGGLVGMLGHLLSAASAGFPAGHLHPLIAAGMFVACSMYGVVARKVNKEWAVWPAGVIGVGLNNAIPFVAVALDMMPRDAAFGLVVPFLLFASSANVVLASLVILGMRRLRTPSI